MGAAACTARHFSRGYLLKSQENYEEAITEFAKVPGDDPLGPLAAREIQELKKRLEQVKGIVAEGEHALGKGQYDRARRLFERALKMSPDDPRAQQGMAAIVAHETGKVNETESVLELQALARTDRFSEIRRKSNAYMKRFPKSEKVQKAAQEAVGRAESREAELTQGIDQADQMADDARTVEAILFLRDLHRKFPTDLRPRERLQDLEDGLDDVFSERIDQARHLADAQDLTGALDLLEGNLKVDPKHGPSQELYRSLVSQAASASYKEGDFAKAVSLWERQLRFDPKDVSARRGLEKARRLMKQLKKM